MPSLSALCLPLMLLGASAATARPADVTATQEQTRADWQRYWGEESSLVPSIRFPHHECFEQAALAQELPVGLLLALARGESNFDPQAASHANAHGLMQIQWPGTAQDLGFASIAELVQPCPNVDGGARYLKMLLERYDNDIHLSLAAYNYGLGRIKPGTERIPDGAAWYSGYIYNHLRYVLEKASPAAARPAPRNYEDEQRLTIQTFESPERAERFVAFLRDKVPQARLDWFDRRLGRWSVDLLYQDEQERERSVQLLESEGGFTVRESER